MSNGNKKSQFKTFGIVGIALAAIAIIISIYLAIWQGRNPGPKPNFSLSVTPMQGAVQKGGVTQTTVFVKGESGYNHSVNLSASGQPTDVIIAFSPPFGSAKPAYTSIMTVNVKPKAPPSEYKVTITGTGADGKEHTCKYTLTITEGAIVSTPPPEVRITSPRQGEEVPISTTVSGTFSGDLQEGQYTWVVINPHPSPGQWWPQGGRIEPWGGRWSVPVWLGREKEDKGKEFDIAVISVSEEGNRYYENYLKVGQETGNYPGVQLPSGTEIIARITVKRK